MYGLYHRFVNQLKMFVLFTGDCYHNTSTQYFGRLNYTVSGRACQNWSKNSPHVTIFRPDRDADKTTNYCRDYSYYKHGTPWCYTEDPDFRWEFCPVFKCSYSNAY